MDATAIERVSPEQYGRGEDVFDHVDDGGLGLTVRVGPWRDVGDADDPVGGADSKQHVFHLVDRSAGEMERLAHLDAVGNGFDPVDDHGLPPR
jgi:hypothetical protein